MRGLQEIADLEDKHPYLISFIISLVSIFFILFYSSPVEYIDASVSTDNIQIVNIDRISSPKRKVKRDISTEEGEPVAESVVERARGASLEDSALDIAYYPNVVPPRSIGRLKKLYPKIAREQNVEATLNIELLISAEGIVLNVDVLGVLLSKNFPPERYKSISRAFSRDAIKILLGARFSPAIYEGKKVPVKMELPLKFRLED